MDIKNRGVLITGATGFIGKVIADRLISSGYKVHGITRGPVSTITNSGVRWHRGDLLDSEMDFDFLEHVSVDSMMHLAWFTKPDEFWNSYNNVLWYESTKLLISKAVKCGVKKILFVGSSAELAASPLSDVNGTEHSLHSYGYAKREAAEFISRLCRDYGVAMCHARVFFPYGPNMNQQKLIPQLIRSALGYDNSINIRCPDAIRDYIHVYDVAAALIKCLETDFVGTFDLGTGWGVMTADIFRYIQHYVRTGTKIELKNYTKDIELGFKERDIIVANTDQLISLVDLSDHIPFEDGIVDLILREAEGHRGYGN